jgi:hypothetical protein
MPMSDRTGVTRGSLILVLQESHDREVAQLLTALERGDLNHKEISNQRPAELLNELSGSGGRSTYNAELVAEQAGAACA